MTRHNLMNTKGKIEDKEYIVCVMAMNMLARVDSVGLPFSDPHAKIKGLWSP